MALKSVKYHLTLWSKAKYEKISHNFSFIWNTTKFCHKLRAPQFNENSLFKANQQVNSEMFYNFYQGVTEL